MKATELDLAKRPGHPISGLPEIGQLNMRKSDIIRLAMFETPRYARLLTMREATGFQIAAPSGITMVAALPHCVRDGDGLHGPDAGQ